MGTIVYNTQRQVNSRQSRTGVIQAPGTRQPFASPSGASKLNASNNPIPGGKVRSVQSSVARQTN